MKKLILSSMVLGAFMAANVYATPQPLDIYGGWDPNSTPTWEYLLDYYGNPLEGGDCVVIYWVGPNGIGESPDYCNPPEPGGDDVKIGETQIEYGGFFIMVTTYQAGFGHPEPCDEIYVAVYAAPCGAINPWNWYYGVSNQHHVENYMGETMYTHFPGELHGTYIHVPVKLMTFEVLGRDGEVLLEWKTATETNTFGFHIERSLDAVDFHRITEEAILSAGNSETENTYTYVDRGLANGTTYYYNLISVGMDGEEEVANEKPVSATPTALVPTVFALHQNYPNPFNPNTDIRYQIPKDSGVTLKIYNVLGQEIVTLVDDNFEAGSYTATWNAQDSQGVEVPAGIYFYTMRAGEFTQTRKMVLLK